MPRVVLLFLFFFFNDTATTEIYTLSLHDALPISAGDSVFMRPGLRLPEYVTVHEVGHNWFQGLLASVVADLVHGDRKSTRLNSSHQIISYAVFCLKKKIQTQKAPRLRDEILHLHR